MDISLKEMLKAGVHFGHCPRRWNPKMKPYIFGKRAGVYIIDLEKSATKLMEAMVFLQRAVSDGKTVLFATTKLQAVPVVTEGAKQAKLPYMTGRWIGGFLTNFKIIKKRIKYLLDLEERFAKGEMEKYTKKERMQFGKTLQRLQTLLGGVKYVDALPDVLVTVDVVRDQLAIKEAHRMKVPVVSLVDVDGDPSLVDYPIPANDDAVSSLKYVIGQLLAAIEDGRKHLPKNKPVRPAKSEDAADDDDDAVDNGGLEIKLAEVSADVGANLTEELTSKA